jgi:hypothetical protein
MSDQLPESLKPHRELLPKEAEEILLYWWGTGNLRGLLYDHQLPMYDLQRANPSMTTVFHCSRRLGKSAVNLAILMEECLQKDGAIARFGALTQKSVQEIILPIMSDLTRFAPPRVKPKWHSSGRYLFPHRPSSQLVIAGVDLNIERLRGNASDVFALDESAFYKDLEYVIKDVVLPQFLTRPKGKLILSSTSPITPAHPFVFRMEKAKEENAYIKRTIYDDSRPHVRARIPEYMKESGGADSTTWRREYLCEVLIDESSALIPEFAKPEIESRAVKAWDLPPYLVPYTFIDLGYTDNAAAVFGFTDFKNGRKVVLDEFLISNANSKQIKEAVSLQEERIWGKEKAHLIRRYADGQPLTIADFNEVYDYPLTKVSEDTVEAKINRVRVDLVEGRLIIHPRCTRLIKELKYGIWDDARKKMARVEGFGHFDLLSALTYFCMHGDLSENPYPKRYMFDEFRQQQGKGMTDEELQVAKAIKSIFNLDQPFH